MPTPAPLGSSPLDSGGDRRSAPVGAAVLRHLGSGRTRMGRRRPAGGPGRYSASLPLRCTGGGPTGATLSIIYRDRTRPVPLRMLPRCCRESLASHLLLLATSRKARHDAVREAGLEPAHR